MSGELAIQSLFGLLLIAAGALLVVGALRRWAWLVDPPTYLWFCYSQSLLKAVFGSEGCRLITVNMGVLFACAGLFLVVRSIL